MQIATLCVSIVAALFALGAYINTRSLAPSAAPSVTQEANPTINLGAAGDPADAKRTHLSGSEAAALAGVHPDTFYSYLAEGRVTGAQRTQSGRWEIARDFEILPKLGQ